MDIQKATDLHAMQTKLACKALFERNPEGLDNPELFKQLFLREAAQTAQTALNKTKAEFAAKSLHQKVEIGPPEILSTRDNAFYTSADVQLIRVGSYQGSVDHRSPSLRVKFKILVNPDLTPQRAIPNGRRGISSRADNQNMRALYVENIWTLSRDGLSSRRTGHPRPHA